MSTQRLSKVLVVDDDPVIGKSFDRVLSRQGYAVVTATNGEEALRKIASEEYDAVFTDIKMPGVDGITVAERIKAQRPWMPVVIVSGYATLENEARAKDAGVYAVLHKPLTPQMIEQSAREALHSGAEHGATEAEPPVPSPRTVEPEATVAVAPPPVAPTLPTPAPTTAATPPTPQVQPTPAAHEAHPVLRMIAAPFITLAFLTVGPFLGLAAMVVTPLWHFAKWLMARPTTQFSRWGRDIALFFAAPFLALAYIISLPFVGFGVIGWVAIKALLGRHGKTAEPHVELK